MRAIDRKLVRELWMLRGQALAIAFVIMGGVATWIISFSTIDSLVMTQESFYREGRFAEIFASVRRAPERLRREIAELPGVGQLETRVNSGATLEVAGFPDPVMGQFVSLPDEGQPLLNRLYLRAGTLPGPRAADEIVISQPFADAHGLEPGDAITAILNGRRRDLTVVGIALSPEFVYQIRPGDLFPDFERYGIVWMRRQPLATAFDLEGAFNDLALTLAPGAVAEEVIDRLDLLLAPYGGVGAFPRDDQISHLYLSQEIEQLEASALIIPFIFLGVASFLLSVVVSRIVAQQRDLIAVLKAFGYSNRAVGAHYAGMILLVVGLGSVPGILAGAWAGQSLARLYSQFFFFPYLEFHLGLDVMLNGVLVAAAAALLAALGAVRRASRLPPAEAMRPEPPASYRPTLVERLGLQRLFDQPTRMILRHIERKPLKSLISVLGIALAGAMLVVSGFQRDAIDYMVGVQFNLAQRDDLQVSFVEPASRKALFELAGLPGVHHAEPYRAVPVELRAGHRSHRTAIQGYEQGAVLRRALDADLRPIAIPAEGLLLTDHLGEKLGVGAGDILTVQVLEGARPLLQVPVAGLVSEFIGLASYMDIAALNRLMREGPAISGAFLAVDPAAREGLFRELLHRPRVLGVTQRDVAISAFYESFAETLLVLAFVYTLLAGSIAFGVVYNSVRIALSEHSRELASLRVLGFSRGEVAYILLGELALLTLAAIPVSFLIGREFARVIAESVASELFRIPLIIEPATYGFTALVLLVATLLSALLIAKRLYHLDMVAVLKTRE